MALSSRDKQKEFRAPPTPRTSWGLKCSVLRCWGGGSPSMAPRLECLPGNCNFTLSPAIYIPHVSGRGSVQFSKVQSLSPVQLSVTPWTAARQASLSIPNSQSLLKLVSIESVIPSNHLILCRPLLLPPSVFPSIRVFSNESALCMRWSKYWSFSFNISPSNEHPGLISFALGDHKKHC